MIVIITEEPELLASQLGNFQAFERLILIYEALAHFLEGKSNYLYYRDYAYFECRHK